MRSKKTLHQWMAWGLMSFVGVHGVALQGCKPQTDTSESAKAQAHQEKADVADLLSSKATLQSPAARPSQAPMTTPANNAPKPNPRATDIPQHPTQTKDRATRLDATTQRSKEQTRTALSSSAKRPSYREGTLLFRNGQKRLVYSFRSGKREGQWASFYKNGQTRLVRHYKEGRLHGLTTAFFANGKAQTEQSFLHGKRDGIWKVWDKQGKLLWERHYAKGKLHGPSKRFLNDRETTVFFAEGKRKRQQTVIYKKGKKQTLLERDLEKEMNRWIAFYPNGKKKRDYQEIKGKRHGVELEWFANGQKKREAHYESGNLHGKWKCWNESGTWSMEGEYREGKKHGDWSVWRAPKAKKVSKAKKARKPTVKNRLPAKAQRSATQNSAPKTTSTHPQASTPVGLQKRTALPSPAREKVEEPAPKTPESFGPPRD